MKINLPPTSGRRSTLLRFASAGDAVIRQPSTLFPASLLLLLLLITNFAFSQGRKNDEKALNNLLRNPALKSAHVGVYVYDDSLKKDIAAFQDDKYFVPASNTKLFSLYAGMKYL